MDLMNLWFRDAMFERLAFALPQVEPGRCDALRVWLQHPSDLNPKGAEPLGSVSGAADANSLGNLSNEATIPHEATPAY